MGEDQETTQESTQQSSTTPWARGLPLIDRMFSTYGGMNPSVTPGQATAWGNLRNATMRLPDFSNQLIGGLDKAFATGDNAPQIGMWNDAYKNLQTNLGGVARGDFLDPYSTPGMSSWLDSLGSDITNRVKGVYAGSGRSPSGAGSFSERLGRGLSEGLAPVVANQANQNRRDQMSAAEALFRAGGGTAQGTAGLNRGSIDNYTTAAGMAGMLPGMLTSGQRNMFDVENLGYGLPFQNAGMLLNPAMQLASMGQDSTGSGTQTKTQQGNLFSDILGGVMGASALGKAGGIGSIFSGLGGLFGGAGGAGATAAGLGSIMPSVGSIIPSLLSLLPFSDERTKENIERVGALDDGQPIYSYNYIWDETPRIGLMAQEVEKVVPDAITELPGGIKMVDYTKATRGARAIRGLMDDMLEAA